MFLTSPAKARHVRHDGSFDFEGHGSRPGETRHYESVRELWTDGGGRFRLDWTTWAKGDSTAEPESFLMIGDDIYHRDSPTAKWKYQSGGRRDRAWFQLFAAAPWLIAKGKMPVDVTRFVPGAGRISYFRAKPHPRLGDVRDSVCFEYASGEESVPERTKLTLYERDSMWRLADEASWLDGKAPPDSLLAEPGWSMPEDDESDSLVPDPLILVVAPGVWSVELKDIGSRTLVVEFADYLAVIEAAVGSANGERIVDVVKRRWPSKPIRYFLFSHHHPHYVGGVRAFIAEGATIVTTPGNEAVVRAAAARPFTIQPDRLARSPRKPDIRVFTKRFELADSTNRLVAIDIGDRSDHTAEFAIFWLPKQKVLFETEQGWVTVDGKLRASRRAKTLLHTLEEEKVTADWFVQSWPMQGEPSLLARAELDSLIAARGH